MMGGPLPGKIVTAIIFRMLSPFATLERVGENLYCTINYFLQWANVNVKLGAFIGPHFTSAPGQVSALESASRTEI